MAKVGSQRAAELTGKSKSTIQRAMNNGKLSYELDNNKRKVIDVSELERVFGLDSKSETKSSGSSVEAELQKAADMMEMERLKMRVKMLEQQLDTNTSHLEDMQQQRDEWQKQAQQVLITSQHSQKQADEYKAEVKQREERSRKKREQLLAERMQKMKERSENQNQRQTATEPEKQQSIWQKILGKKAA